MAKAYNTPMNADTLGDLIDDFPVDVRVSISTLSSLDNVSNQLLSIISSDSFNSETYLLFNPRNVNSRIPMAIKSFHSLLTIFIEILRVYGIDNDVGEFKILEPKHIVKDMWYQDSPTLVLLKTFEKDIITTIRKCNVLIYFLTVLGCLNFKIDKLQEDFLDVFAPNTLFEESPFNINEQLLRKQWLLYLDLKTRIYIEKLKRVRYEKLRAERAENPNINLIFQNQEDSNKESGHEQATSNEISKFDHVSEDERSELLENNLFSNTFTNELVLRRTKSSADPTLTTSFERVFVQRYITRKANLMSFSSLKKLEIEISEKSFITNLKDYCDRYMSLIIWGTKHRNSKNPIQTADNSEFDEQVLKVTNAELLIGVVPYKTIFVDNEFEAKKARKVENEIESSQQNVDEIVAGIENDTDLLVNENFSNENVSNNSTQLSESNVFNNDVSVMENLEQQTRSVISTPKTAKRDSTGKVMKLKSKWSKTEEDALVAGLKAFGPSWVKILDYHGSGGKFSEDLKNRSQVQLKDKARNWKIQYLRNGHPLPQYLTKVTGNLNRKRKQLSIESTPEKLPEIRRDNTVHNNQNDMFGNNVISNAASSDASSFDPNL
ncbi:hypothetical protein TPHA_0F03170 [Tetrapisispora phaffii CBS 4417]|uniref:HTH myb-type domain-containing protein n=1 Tax=Tetrapisispora phaffii (strain ATCC 24235 / CBS 4417 / NBRC 1672 / NRRL Y-8282 / UCD 70-5) TaxID=1071381 RepID=G8BUL2_TETPH|nr:hypothetical protein TPHA_0F03170 [Tetrapisispora phaffii CBS 4417]CCE63798.1 hypothetical protein TPHA_0F03170 [Tetrapisispora phaffii CBS 4417]